MKFLLDWNIFDTLYLVTNTSKFNFFINFNVVCLNTVHQCTLNFTPTIEAFPPSAEIFQFFLAQSHSNGGGDNTSTWRQKSLKILHLFYEFDKNNKITSPRSLACYTTIKISMPKVRFIRYMIKSILLK